VTLVFERRVYTSQVNISNENIFSCRKWCRTEYRNMNFKSECLLFLVAWFWNHVSSLFMSPDYSVL